MTTNDLFYEFRTPKLDGVLKFAFDRESGQCVGFWNQERKLTKEQQDFLAANFPIRLLSLQQLAEAAGATLVEVSATPFSVFWEAYDHKRSKERALKLWNKLSESQKRKAVAYIPRYEQRRMIDRSGKLYPDTYLNNKVWEDEK